MKETATKERRITPEIIAKIKERIKQLIERKKDDIDPLIIANNNQDKITAVDDFKNRTESEIEKLQKTLETIDDDKNYGKCISCGEDIPIERLKSEPTANRCTRCKIIHDKKN